MITSLEYTLCFSQVYQNYGKMADFYSQLSNTICQVDPETLAEDSLNELITSIYTMHGKQSATCKEFSTKMKAVLDEQIKPLLSEYKSGIDKISSKRN